MLDSKLLTQISLRNSGVGRSTGSFEAECKKRFRSPFYVPEPQAITVPHDYIGLATALRRRQEKLTFIRSMCITQMETSVTPKTLCI